MKLAVDTTFRLRMSHLLHLPTLQYGPALEMITNTYPHFIEVRALPLAPKTGIELIQELSGINHGQRFGFIDIYSPSYILTPFYIPQ